MALSTIPRVRLATARNPIDESNKNANNQRIVRFCRTRHAQKSVARAPLSALWYFVARRLIGPVQRFTGPRTCHAPVCRCSPALVHIGSVPGSFHGSDRHTLSTHVHLEL